MSVPLPPWTRRDNLSVPAHQRLVDGYNAISFLTGSGDNEVRTAVGGTTFADRKPLVITAIEMGKVTTSGPLGEPDYTDTNRYWVEKKNITVDTPGDPTSNADLEDDDSPSGEMLPDGGDFIADNPVTAIYFNLSGAPDLEEDDVVVLLTAYAKDDQARSKVYVIIPLVPPASTGGAIIVKITDTYTGGGKYKGRVMFPPDVAVHAVSDAGNVSEADIGTVDTNDVLIINLLEVNTGTHWIDPAADQVYFIATFLQRTTIDSVDMNVYSIQGFQTTSCP